VPKIVFDLQLANLPIQDIGLCLAGSTLGRATAVKNTGRAVQQLLFPIVDLVRMNPELACQLGDRPVALDRRQRHLRLKRRVVLLACPLHILLLRPSALSRGRAHLSQLSQFRGPSQIETT
jgi:hypothetical protein